MSFGAWTINGSWVTVDDEQSLVMLHTAIDLGVNFIDTTDVYGDGQEHHRVRVLLPVKCRIIRRELPADQCMSA